MKKLHWNVTGLALIGSLCVTLPLGCDDGDADEDTGAMSGTTTQTPESTTSGDSQGDTGADESGPSNDESGGGGGPPFGSEEDVEMATALWATMRGWDTWEQPVGAEGVVPSMAPHEAFAEIYVNGVAAADDTYPAGSIVVKENVSDMAGEVIVALTVMERIEGFEPEAGDWFWAKYMPDGSLFTNPDGVPLAGRVGLGGDMGCIPCHSGAAGGDFLFIND